MKQVLLVIANFIAFSCAMTLWQFIFPPRLYIYDLLSIAFIFLFFLYYCLRTQPWFLRRELKYFLFFQWAYLLVMIVSGINLMFSATEPEAFTQYLKNVLSDTVYVVFFTCFILFLSIIKSQERKKILKFYIAGVICSCLYGLMHMALSTHYGINLDDYIWNHISYHTAYEFDATPTWKVMGITRGRGFPGVNAAATYVVTVLPFLFLGASIGQALWARIINVMLVVIAVSGLFVTMSRTGVLSSAVALLTVFLLARKRLVNMVCTFSFVSVPIAFLGYLFWEYISEILKYRPTLDFSRLQLFEGGLLLSYQNLLLGVGTNNYSIVRLSLPGELYQDANLHSSWLTILVELGMIGLFLEIAFIVYIIYRTSLRKNKLSRAFTASIVGLSVGAFVNQVFDLYYFNFFVVLFFTLIVLGEGDPFPGEKRKRSVFSRLRQDFPCVC